MNNTEVVISIVLTTLVILILVAGVAIAFFISGRQRINQQIELAETRLKYEQELRKAETEISENMMERFARELHDNIGHLLTCMRITIENKKLDEPQLTETFEPIEGYLDDASEQLRQLSRSLNTDYISNIGLAEAIMIEVDRTQRLRRLQVHYQKNENSITISKNQQLMVFRIFQEMLHNAIRHSKAKNLHVVLHTGEGFTLEVSDDGIGFDPATVLRSPKASGLNNIIKRARIVDMECQVISSPGSGCRYMLQLLNKRT